MPRLLHFSAWNVNLYISWYPLVNLNVTKSFQCKLQKKNETFAAKHRFITLFKCLLIFWVYAGTMSIYVIFFFSNHQGVLGLILVDYFPPILHQLSHMLPLRYLTPDSPHHLSHTAPRGTLNQPPWLPMGMVCTQSTPWLRMQRQQWPLN